MTFEVAAAAATAVSAQALTETALNRILASLNTVTVRYPACCPELADHYSLAPLQTSNDTGISAHDVTRAATTIAPTSSINGTAGATGWTYNASLAVIVTSLTGMSQLMLFAAVLHRSPARLQLEHIMRDHVQAQRFPQWWTPSHLQARVWPRSPTYQYSGRHTSWHGPSRLRRG